MTIVGLTGGIGSGKSTVANFLKDVGVPIYDSDANAKLLMNNNPILRQQIEQLFGADAYQNNQLNRALVGELVFNNPKLLNQLNSIVHPAVANHFKEWVVMQKAWYVVKEAAILFESGAHNNCDFVICVIAHKKTRLQRVMQRDGVTKEQVLNRMNKQMTDDERLELSDFVIHNNQDLAHLKQEAHRVHKILLEKINSNPQLS